MPPLTLTLIVSVLGSIIAGLATPTDVASVGAMGAMVFVILLGATAFALVFTRMGGDVLVQQFLEQMPGGKVGAVIVVMLIMFILGFFLDTFEIVFIVVPITAPILLLLGMDPILLGVMIGLVLQTSFLTPPSASRCSTCVG